MAAKPSKKVVVTKQVDVEMVPTKVVPVQIMPVEIPRDIVAASSDSSDTDMATKQPEPKKVAKAATPGPSFGGADHNFSKR